MKVSIVMDAEMKSWVESKIQWCKSNFVFVLAGTALSFTCVIGLLVFFHFQLGADIWFLEVKNQKSAEYWGQIGDFVGGLLNPLLSFFALIAVLFNLVLQRKELSLARQDAKEAHDTQKTQSEIFERQNFESVFFRLLDTHTRLASTLKFKGVNKELCGEEAFEAVVHKFLPLNPIFFGEGVDREIEYVRQSAAEFMRVNKDSAGHYFRSLYQILKYIDSYGQVAVKLSRSTSIRLKIRKAQGNYDRQRVYANMVRAQLSSSEVSCIFLNCLSKEGDGLKGYVEKFSVLKTLNLPTIYDVDSVKGAYAKIAYLGSEYISSSDIVEVSRAIYGRNSNKVVREDVKSSLSAWAEHFTRT